MRNEHFLFMQSILLVLTSAVLCFMYWHALVFFEERKQWRLVSVGMVFSGAVGALSIASTRSVPLFKDYYLLIETSTRWEAFNLLFLAPVAEEWIKGLVFVAGYSALKRVQKKHELLFLTLMVGLGFAALENAVFVAAAFKSASLEVTLLTILLRSIVGVWNHSLFTLPLATAIHTTKTMPKARRLVVVVFGFMVAVLVHSFYNMLTGTGSFLSYIATVLFMTSGWALFVFYFVFRRDNV